MSAFCQREYPCASDEMCEFSNERGCLGVCVCAYACVCLVNKSLMDKNKLGLRQSNDICCLLNISSEYMKCMHTSMLNEWFAFGRLIAAY